MTDGQSGKGSRARLWRGLTYVLTFVMMFGLWIIFSGNFDPLMLSLGAISSLIVALLSTRFLFPEPDLGLFFLSCFRLLWYIPWIISQIFIANLHLLYLVFHPRMMELIDPHLITFRTSLRKDLAIATMANSITLTPGTITVTASLEGEFQVHTIDRAFSQALPGDMERMVAWVYGEAS